MSYRIWSRITLGLVALALVAAGCAASRTAATDRPTNTTGRTEAVKAEEAETAIWRGNDALDQIDWKQRWGLVGWDEDLQRVLDGFWGYDALDLVEDPLDPDRTVLRVRYDEDGVTTDSGSGLLFTPDVELADPKAARLSYDMLFPEDFDFGDTGGKLPGLFGLDTSSDTPPDATTCAGNFEVESDRCFSARFGYRTLTQLGYPEGQMFYEVIPWMDETECRDTWLCDLPWGEGMVMRTEDPETFRAVTGTWVNITQEVELNDAGRSNGSIRVWYDDELVYDEQDLSIVTGDNVEIIGILFHALFGQGFDLSKGSPATQHSYFANMTLGDIAPGD